MRTVIHIGQHKTGTTSIQYFLQQNREAMARRGLYVPDCIAGYNHPSHYILNVYALDANRYSTMKEKLLRTKPEEYFLKLGDELRKDISKHYSLAEKWSCKDVVWSNEGLYLLNSVREYRRLRELFDEHSSTVACVCCFREPESYKNSYARQLEKQSFKLSTNKDSYRYLEDDSWLLDYSRKTRMLQEVFDEVIAFDYNKNDNIKEFFEVIGYPADNTEEFRLNQTS